MKKAQKAAFTICLSSGILGMNALAASPVMASSIIPNMNSSAYNSDNIFTKSGFKGQCTWFTYGRVIEKLGTHLPSQFYGNAVDWWYSNARSKVYSYGSEPRANSVIVWSGGPKGYGHVGFVEKVVGDTVYFNEGNFSNRGHYEGRVKTLSKEAIKNRGNIFLKGYIYVGGSSNSNSSNNNSGNSSSNNNNITIKRTAKIHLSSNSSGLNVRSNPSLSSSVVGSLSNNASVSIINENNGWAKIKHGSGIGYISTKYLSSSTSNNSSSSNSNNNNNSVTVKRTAKIHLSSNSSLLNVRSNSSTSSSVIGSLRNNASVSIISESNGWAKIKHGSSIGYISTKYLSSSTSNNSSSSNSNNNNSVTVKKTAKVHLSSNSSSLNVRSSSSTSSSIIGSLRNNASVSIISESNGWAKIKHGSSVGYVSTKYLSSSTSSSNNNSSKNNTSSKSGHVKLSSNNSTLNVRSSANTSSRVVGSLKNGSNITIVGQAGGWYKIKYSSSTAFVSSKYVSLGSTPSHSIPKNNTTPLSSTGRVTLSSSSSYLNVRSSASTSSKVLGSLKNGSNITITGKSGDWYKIRYGSYTGYIYSKYISSGNESTVSNNSENKTGYVTLSSKYSILNVRSGASTNNRVVHSLAQGTKVTILGSYGSWYKIKYGNTTGYVYSSYIKQSNISHVSNSRGQSNISSGNTSINDAVSKASLKYGVDKDLILAVIRQESNFSPNVVSSAGAIGLMQLMPATAEWLGVSDPYNIQQNINGGTKYLRQMLNSHGNNTKLALAAYNAGPGTLRTRGVDTVAEISKLPYETRNYVQKVMGYYGK